MRIILSEGFIDKIKGFFENPCTEEMLVALEKLLTKLMMATVSNTSLSDTLAYELQGFKKKNKDYGNPLDGKWNNSQGHVIHIEGNQKKS